MASSGLSLELDTFAVRVKPEMLIYEWSLVSSELQTDATVIGTKSRLTKLHCYVATCISEVTGSQSTTPPALTFRISALCPHIVLHMLPAINSDYVPKQL